MGNAVIGHDYTKVKDNENEELIGLEETDKDFQKTLGHLHLKTPVEIQKHAAEALIQRVLKKNSTLFRVLVDTSIGPLGRDTFELKKVDDNQVQIVGTSGVAVAWGLHYYLKKYCKCHISWEGSQLKLPSILPDVDEIVTSNDRFRYYQNVCTVGYSSPWWQWKQWEKHLDWMALNGINLALAFHAQEAIWERVYLKLGLSLEEIEAHFAGPAFLPWARMGNFRGWGGPLRNSWHRQTIRLQHLILNRMRDLGIVPVLPAFAGHVPHDFIRVFPQANITSVDNWNNFEDQYCCPYFLDPSDPLFQVVGEEFLRTYEEEFGLNHIYNCDPFNENLPAWRDPIFLYTIGEKIYSAMSTVDPDAVWLMQGWLFVHSGFFWTKDRVKTLLSSVPTGRMIILDLQSEQFPQYEKLDSYFGQPFIWCMLHNFGGTLGMFGSVDILNRRVIEARKMENSTMIGTGLTPEGINQNYVIYEFMLETAYRKEPANLYQWFADYAERRYGRVDNIMRISWQGLGLGIYNYSNVINIRGHYVITKRPSLNIKTWYWYDLREFLLIWENFVLFTNATDVNDLYRHDLVDITRQSLQITADFIYGDIVKAFEAKNVTELAEHSSRLLELFDDLEEILASSPDFLLGRWLDEARKAAPDAYMRANHEFNARNQITLWGPNGEIVDYANKQWSGVVADYFRPRWAIFLEALQRALRTGDKFSAQKVKRLIFREVELPFSYSTKEYPTQPIGDSEQIAMKLYSKWKQYWE
ncbi:hypothetical protein TKK_0016835 [Trichogramma kaykai]